MSDKIENKDKTIEEIRATIFDLRPMTFDDLGIKAALERLKAAVLSLQSKQ